MKFVMGDALLVYKGEAESRAKYSRELRRLLLFRLPPREDLATIGITGSFLPVKVVVRSSRRFSKLRGWYWTKYAVTHPIAIIRENAEFYELDDRMMMRLLYRLWTVDVDEVCMHDIVQNIMKRRRENLYSYITILRYRNRNSILIFYLNRHRVAKLTMESPELDYLPFKEFTFMRYNRIICNYVCGYKETYKETCEYLIDLLSSSTDQKHL